MKKLMTMTEFVLDQQIAYDSEEITNGIFRINCYNYAKLLQTPLSLSMFIPCDHNGEPIHKPDFSALQILSPAVDTDTHIKAYQKALESVLFEGWELQSTNSHVADGTTYHRSKIKKGSLILFVENGGLTVVGDTTYRGYDTIEEAILIPDIELTPTDT